MEKLTANEVNTAIETIRVIHGKGGRRSVYIDRLRSGQIGVSVDEDPQYKFDNLGAAEVFAESLTDNLDEREI